MLEKIIELTNEYIESMPKKERKKYGQFFTSMETARFMASLYNIDEKKSKVSVLDAGAGSGILSCAFIERLETIDSIQKIELTCYENDNNVLPLLKRNLEYCKPNTHFTTVPTSTITWHCFRRSTHITSSSQRMNRRRQTPVSHRPTTPSTGF